MDYLRQPGSLADTVQAVEELPRSTCTDIHQSAFVIDGLIASRWFRDVFEAMRLGGKPNLTAAMVQLKWSEHAFAVS
jgi:hypothetical protein